MNERNQNDSDQATLRSIINHVLDVTRSELKTDYAFVCPLPYAAQDDENHHEFYAVGCTRELEPFAMQFCKRIGASELPAGVSNLKQHPDIVLGIGGELSSFRAYVSAPIDLPSRSQSGLVCCVSLRPMPCLTESQARLLRLSANLIARLLQTARDKQSTFATCERRIRHVLEARSIEIVYQPIFRLIDDRIVSFEALSRFPLSPPRPPDIWFAEAESIGLGVDLEFLAVEEAMAGFLSLPQDCSISLNLSPASIATERFRELFGRMPLNRIVLEITEHAAINSYSSLTRALTDFRSQGLRLAIDDVGAGYCSFRHVLDLSPDSIKLDISLTRNIDHHHGRQALASAITQFGRDMGCEVVAEGVETELELRTLKRLGVTKVQGYLISKPLPLKQLKDIRIPKFDCQFRQRQKRGD